MKRRIPTKETAETVATGTETDAPEMKSQETTVTTSVVPTVKSGKNILKGKIARRCLVLYRPEHGGEKLEEIYDAPMGNIWTYKRKQVLVLKENPDNGVLETYFPFGQEIGLPAHRLSRCKQCIPAQRLLQTIKGSLEKVAVWAIVVSIGIGGILIVAIMGELGK